MVNQYARLYDGPVHFVSTATTSSGKTWGAPCPFVSNRRLLANNQYVKVDERQVHCGSCSKKFHWEVLGSAVLSNLCLQQWQLRLLWGHVQLTSYSTGSRT